MKTLDEALEAKYRGMTKSADSAGLSWRIEAIKFINTYCHEHHLVFVDDLWKAGLPEPSSPRALGSVMRDVLGAGWIEEQKIGGCVLARPSKNSNMQLKRVWKSNLCQPKQKELL